jgi:nucleoid DNA-binding protein
MKNKRLNKKDMLNAIYETSNLSKFSKAGIKSIINSVIDFIKIGLYYGYTLELRELGIFSVRKIPEHKRRYKLKYDKIEKEKVIPERYVVIFNESITLLREINKKKPQDENKQNEVKKSSNPISIIDNSNKEDVEKALNEILEDPEKNPISEKSDFYTNSQNK